ncbi:MAG: hypothetical protein IKZ28_01265, partial [Clostridia bacterium]|nr:hypothetical protein [Clostridia bacterium]
FAPILAIPALQNVAQSNAIPQGVKTRYNYEEYVNAIAHTLSPTRCDTDCIIKVYNIQKQGNDTHLGVTAYGYYGVPRVDYVSVHGDDGDWHDVPVEWVEYIPESRASEVKLTSERTDSTQTVAPGLFASVV